jgi:hypothetical protein
MSAAYAEKSGTVAGSPVAADQGRSTEYAAARTTPRTHLRLTRRGRAVLTTLAALPLVLGSVVLAVNGGGAAAEGTSSGGGAAFEYVTVDSGQSLWELAQTVAPKQDPRDVIADIVNLNQLPSEAVQPGQRLALPAGY